MGVAASFQEAFCGRVDQEEFSQIVDLNTYTSGNVVVVFYRELVTRVAKTQTFKFTGLSESYANNTASKTVTDFSGTVYTVPFSASVTDGSSGTKSFEKESVQVSRRKISPALWEVVVRRTGSSYYLNGSKIISGPSWM